MSDQDGNKTFIPFNFSSVLPFDSMACALRELPTPQHIEPEGPFTALPDLRTPPPTSADLAEMTRVIAQTAKDEEWNRDVIADFRSAKPSANNERPPVWLDAFCNDLSSTLQRTFKRTHSPSNAPVRPTPKRPRARQAEEVIDLDGDYAPPSASPEPAAPPTPPPPERTMRRGQRRHAPRPPTHLPQPAPRAITERPPDGSASPTASQQRQAMRNLSHSQELRRHEDARDVENEDFEKFHEQLVSFSERPDALVSTTYDADEPPALLATGNLGVVTDLRQHIALVAPSGSMKHVSPQLLSNVISILQQRIRSCARSCQEGHGSNSPKVSTREASLGVIAVCTVLDLLCAPGSPRSLLVEELLDDIAMLLRSVFTMVVFPMCDPLYQNSKINIKRKRKQKNNRNGQRQGPDDIPELSGDDDDADEEEISPKRKTKRPLRRDEDLMKFCGMFLDGLAALFDKERYLPDSLVSQCVTTCTQSLSVTGIPRLQGHAMKTITMVFSSYPGHRLPLMDEVREAASSFPVSKRFLRPFQLADGNNSVRTSSALMAMLLCAVSKDLESTPAPKHVSNMTPEAMKAWCKDRETCHQRAVKCAVHVLEPMYNRVCQNRDQDFKFAFSAFFEDMLSLFGRPEWPSSELLLQTLSVSIITKMRSDTEKTAYARGVAIDTLGALAARMSSLYGKQVVTGSTASNSFSLADDRLEEAREKILIYLHPEKSSQTASAQSFHEALFVADDYSMASNLDRRTQHIAAERGEIDKDEDEEVLDGHDTQGPDKETLILKVERRALKRAENVRQRLTQGDTLSKDEAYKAATYVSVNRSFVGGFKTILEAVLDGMKDPAPTIRAKTIKALSSMDESCPGLLRAFPSILTSIEPSCQDVSTLVRDAALDLLSRSLLPELTKDCHKNRTENQDSSESENHDLPNVIFEVVLKRLCDTAVSVRKRAIAIMRSILAASLARCEAAQGAPPSATDVFQAAKVHNKRIVHICTNLVSRLDDPEPSVKEVAERTLRFGVFGFDISQALPDRNVKAGSAAQLAQRMISMFAELPSSIHSTFMSRLVHKAIMVKQSALLRAVIGAAVDQFHDYEEQVSSVCAGRSTAELSGKERALVIVLSKRRVASASLLSAFGSLDASLIEPYGRPLAPSLKGVVEGQMSEYEFLTVQRILQVLEIGIGQSNSVDPSFLEEVIRDVEAIVCMSPVPILEDASAKCFCVCAKKFMGDDEDKYVIHRVAESFKKFLDDHLDSPNTISGMTAVRSVSPIEKNARCALVRLGLLARYGDLELGFVEETFNTLDRIARISAYGDKRGILSRAAARGLSHFLIRHRSFLPKGTPTLVSMMDGSHEVVDGNPERSDAVFTVMHQVQTVDQGVQLCIFQGFHELLRDEEERNTSSREDGQTEPDEIRDEDHQAVDAEKGSASEPKGEKIILAAEEDAEAGHLAVSAQSLTPYLTGAVFCNAVQIRRIVANVLGLLVRQGLLLPATIVTSLYTLSLDTDHICRDYAFRVISFIADRYSGMLASAAIPALRVCFKNSFTLYTSIWRRRAQLEATREISKERIEGNHETNGTFGPSAEYAGKITWAKVLEVAIDQKTGHSLLSPAIMAMRREQRRGILENLMREFDPRVVVISKPKPSPISSIPANNGPVDAAPTSAADVDGGAVPPPANVEHDDDVGEMGNEDLDLKGGRGGCDLASLYFFALTLACVDYTNGAGVGGSLTHGGGTSAAEGKLKIAKEEVTELVSTATRIVSNSGQAILRVAKHVWHCGTADAGTKARLAILASRMCVLLSLKYHLKFERWRGSEEEVRDAEEAGGSSLVRMPIFSPDCELLTAVGWKGDDVVLDEDSATRQIDVFFRMMREDAIDEADLTVPSRRGGRSAAKGKGRSSGKRQRKGSAIASASRSLSQAQRRRNTRRTSTTKRLNYDDGSQGEKDEGSDYDPRS